MKIVDKILILVKDRDLTSVEIATRLKIPKGNCQVYLNTLYKQGRIIRTTNKKPYKYRISPIFFKAERIRRIKEIKKSKVEIKKYKAELEKSMIESKIRRKDLKELQDRIDKQIEKHNKSTKEFEEWMAIRSMFEKF